MERRSAFVDNRIKTVRVYEVHPLHDADRSHEVRRRCSICKHTFSNKLTTAEFYSLDLEAAEHCQSEACPTNNRAVPA